MSNKGFYTTVFLVTVLILQGKGACRGGVTLCAPRARARAVFGPDKCKDLCGHAQFLLRNVPEKDFETFELLS